MPLYDMHSALQAKDGAGTMLEKMDYLTFFSAGGVQLFLERYGGIPERTVPVYIGPISARTLKERCRKLFLVAEEISTEGIVQKIVEHKKTLK